MVHSEFHVEDGTVLSPAHLVVEKASIKYAKRVALQDVSFKVLYGSQVAVVGPNGAGKSTLFKAIVGLLPLDSGQILIHEKPLKTHVDCVAYIPQREDVDWKFPVSVLDVVLMGRFGKLRGFKQPSKRDREIAMHCLSQMGMQIYYRRAIGDLSGGQQQRVFIARALAQEPHILLMDEPFSGIDMATQESTLSLMDTLKQEQVTVLVATHDLELARQRFTNVLMLNHRVVAYGSASEVFTAQTMSETFTGQVLFIDGAAVIDQCCPHDDNHNQEH